MRSRRFGLFEIFKYVIYLLLGVNLMLFFQEEWLALAHRFEDGVTRNEVVSAFAASIDTAAWLVLLILFELETTLLRDRSPSRAVALTIQILTGVCYLLIVGSFWGYASKVVLLLQFAPSAADACSLVGSGASLAIDLDEYVAFSASTCQTLGGVVLMKLADLAIFATEQSADMQLLLAWVDVINSAAWLGVVAVLAVDVFLQQRDMLSGSLLATSVALKVVLYAALVLAAVYWGMKGDFVDVWDAVLWLVAFAFIEMNLLDWNSESSHEETASVPSTPIR